MFYKTVQVDFDWSTGSYVCLGYSYICFSLPSLDALTKLDVKEFFKKIELNVDPFILIVKYTRTIL